MKPSHSFLRWAALLGPTASGYVRRREDNSLVVDEAPDFVRPHVLPRYKVDNETLETTQLPHHFAMQMEEGQLALALAGYPETYLI